MVGYSDQAHFARAFKALTGLTPQEFRRINRPGIPVAAE
jgi:AraC-like DNA-binding protein